MIIDFHVHMLDEHVFRASTNKTVFSNLYFPDFGGISQYSIGNPRTVGVALDVKF